MAGVDDERVTLDRLISHSSAVANTPTSGRCASAIRFSVATRSTRPSRGRAASPATSSAATSRTRPRPGRGRRHRRSPSRSCRPARSRRGRSRRPAASAARPGGRRRRPSAPSSYGRLGYERALQLPPRVSGGHRLRRAARRVGRRPGQLGDHLEVAARPPRGRSSIAQKEPSTRPRGCGSGSQRRRSRRGRGSRGCPPGARRRRVLDSGASPSSTTYSQKVRERRLAVLDPPATAGALALEELMVGRHVETSATGTPRVRDTRFIEPVEDRLGGGVQRRGGFEGAQAKGSSTAGYNVGRPEPDAPAPCGYSAWRLGRLEGARTAAGRAGGGGELTRALGQQERQLAGRAERVGDRVGIVEGVRRHRRRRPRRPARSPAGRCWSRGPQVQRRQASSGRA